MPTSEHHPIIDPEYLGDGAYVSFDGYQWWLAANDHRNPVIALEPAVMKNLQAYVARTVAAINARQAAESSGGTT
jgi:hypothetical protein